MIKIGDWVRVVSGNFAGERGKVAGINPQTGEILVTFKLPSTASWSTWFNTTDLTLESTSVDLSYFLGDYDHDGMAISPEQRKKWKDEGRCQECGEMLPMSIWGLGECPKHPKPAGPQ